MPQAPSQWVYSALVGMSLLLAGWLWQIVGSLSEDINRIQETKAERTAAGDRWTGSQQIEYMRYVESRFKELDRQQEQCMTYLKGHSK